MFLINVLDDINMLYGTFPRVYVCTEEQTDVKSKIVFTAALALRSRSLVIGSREKEKEEKEGKKEEEEKNLQIAIRRLWDLFD